MPRAELHDVFWKRMFTRPEEGRAMLQKLLKRDPGVSAAAWLAQNPYRDDADRRFEIGGLLTSGARQMVLEDPDTGQIGKAGPGGLMSRVAKWRGNETQVVLMSMPGVVIDVSASPVTVWAWIAVQGTPFVGGRDHESHRGPHDRGTHRL